MAEEVVLDGNRLPGVDRGRSRPTRLLDARHPAERVVAVLEGLAIAVGELCDAPRSVHDEPNRRILRVVADSLVESTRLVEVKQSLVAERIRDRRHRSAGIVVDGDRAGHWVVASDAA